MQPSDRRVRITEDVSSIILSIENSPLTEDVHRCLTGADYLSLPQPTFHDTYTDSTCESDRSGSTDTDSLSQRVANLLNKKNDYQEVAYTSDEKYKTPSAPIDSYEAGATASASSDVGSNFQAGSFLTSSRVEPNSLSKSPSKISGTGQLSYLKPSSGSTDELVAPPPEFADVDSAMKSTVGTSSAVQTLLKSLEWDHAWDVSAPTRFASHATTSITSTNNPLGNTSFTVESHSDRRVESPKPKNVLLGSTDFASMTSSSRANAVSPSYSPSTSPDFSAKYFSEMKHLVEEQMQRREASIGPLLHGTLSLTGESSYSNGSSALYNTLSRRHVPLQAVSNSSSSSSSSDTVKGGALPPPVPRSEFDRNREIRSIGQRYNLDVRNDRLPPPGHLKTGNSFLHSAGDLSSQFIPSHHDNLSADYRSFNRGFSETTGRLSTSHSDLTTVTSRTGSADLSTHSRQHHHRHHHHHELHPISSPHLDDLHSRVVDILTRRAQSSSRSVSSDQSGETTTVESTHPGSNDAIPPCFPTGIYGNRPFTKDRATARLDASVQTSASRLPASWTPCEDIPSYSGTASAGVQTSAARQTYETRGKTAGTDASFVAPKLTLTGGSGTLDLDAIAELLEEPIRVAVKKCLESELRAANVVLADSRPTSRASFIDGNRSPVSTRVNSRHEHQISPTETATSASGHAERLLDSERRIADLARLKAEEQAQRVRRLEDALSSDHSPNNKPAEPTDRDHDAHKSGIDKRSPSPTTSLKSRSPSPTKSPILKKKVASPVAWFVPADPPRQKPKEKSSPPLRGVRLDFAAPSRKDSNFLTGRIQTMLEPVSPTKPKEDLTLQDALRLSNRSFLVRSAERLRRLRLHAIERRLTTERKKAAATIDLEQDYFLEEQAEKVAAEVKATKRSATASSRNNRATRTREVKLDRPKTAGEMLFAELLACDTASVASTTSEMKRIRVATQRRAMMLPEAIRRVEQERRQLQVKQNRIRCEIYKQKVLNKLLGRNKWMLPRCLCSDSVLDRVLLH